MNKAIPRIPNYLSLCEEKKKKEEGKVKDIETEGKVIGFDF